MGNCVGDSETYVFNALNLKRSPQKRVEEHYKELKDIGYNDYDWVTVMLQGSQNYELDYEGSDIDTKAILLPSFKDIVLNHKPVSTTHIRKNDEHIDLKDIRLMLQCYKKQNLNFVETLFTSWRVVNPIYYQEWQKLVHMREEIARYNPYAAVKSMKGIAMEKYHALYHPYPVAAEEIMRFGYSSKQLHHLLRVQDFLIKYIQGEEYKKCMIPEGWVKKELLEIKTHPGLFSFTDAVHLAESTLANITKIADDFCAETPNKGNKEIDLLFEEVLANILKIRLKEELK